MNSPFLERWRPKVDEELDRLLPGETAWPRNLHRAIRHSVFAGGKRLRPVLALAAAQTCGGGLDAIVPAACGIEMIHTYSLIHDDLPALDNDDWRRGVATCHKKFGEAVAILAGDALLTHGLGAMARYPEGARYDGAKVRALNAVVAAIGTGGMIGGQMEDLEAEKETPGSGPATEARLEKIHASKTGRLITASLELGGILSFAGDEKLAALEKYGRFLGLAFQIKDDILDVESSRERLGKEAGKDAAHGKLTFPGVYGLEESRVILARTVAQAQAAAHELEGERQGDGEESVLKSFADYVGHRGN